SAWFLGEARSTVSVIVRMRRLPLLPPESFRSPVGCANPALRRHAERPATPWGDHWCLLRTPGPPVSRPVNALALSRADAAQARSKPNSSGRDDLHHHRSGVPASRPALPATGAADAGAVIRGPHPARRVRDLVPGGGAVRRVARASTR